MHDGTRLELWEIIGIPFITRQPSEIVYVCSQEVDDICTF